MASTSDSPAGRRTQSERSGDTQQRLIRATIEVLKQKGYAGLRTAAVAEVAGVSRGGLLHHYPSKDELVLASVEFVLHRARERAIQRIRQAAGAENVFDAVIADAKEFFFSEDFGVVLDLVLMGGKNHAFRAHIKLYAERHRVPVEQAWLELLVARGIPGSHARQLLALTLTVVRGLSIRALWQHDEALFDSMFETWRQMVSAYLEQQDLAERQLA